MVDPQGGLASSRIAGVPATARRPDLFPPPGGDLVWMIVLLEMLTFGIGLIVFLRFKAAEPESFQHGQAGLGEVPAFVYTLLLLTGGRLMANALDRIRAQRLSDARRGWDSPPPSGRSSLSSEGGYAKKPCQGLDSHHDFFQQMASARVLLGGTGLFSSIFLALSMDSMGQILKGLHLIAEPTIFNEPFQNQQALLLMEPYL